MQDHTLQRTTRRIDFGRAGFVLLTVVADPFAMSHDDRQFVFELLDSIDDHKSAPKERDERTEVREPKPPEAPKPVFGAGAIEAADAILQRENEEASQQMDALLIESEPTIGSMGEISEPELENAPPAPQYLIQALIETEAEAAERAAQDAALTELQASVSTFNRSGIFGHVYETDPGMQRRLG